MLWNWIRPRISTLKMQPFGAPVIPNTWWGVQDSRPMARRCSEFAPEKFHRFRSYQIFHAFSCWEGSQLWLSSSKEMHHAKNSNNMMWMLIETLHSVLRHVLVLSISSCGETWTWLHWTWLGVIRRKRRDGQISFRLDTTPNETR